MIEADVAKYEKPRRGEMIEERNLKLKIRN
jgi:hypothetical protein